METPTIPAQIQPLLVPKNANHIHSAVRSPWQAARAYGEALNHDEQRERYATLLETSGAADPLASEQDLRANEAAWRRSLPPQRPLLTESIGPTCMTRPRTTLIIWWTAPHWRTPRTPRRVRRPGAPAAVMTERTLASCQWCERPFGARQTGGRAQRFCQPTCRRAFHFAVRTWALDAIANGTLTVAEIRNGPATTRALVPAANSLAPVGEVLPQRLAPAASRPDSRYTSQQDLERLMAEAIAMRRR